MPRVILRHVDIEGEYFAYQPRGVAAVIRCLRRRHRTAMSGGLPSGSFVERCTCGASRYSGSPWLHDGKPLRLVSRRKSARLIAEDHQRQHALIQALDRAGTLMERTRQEP